MTNRRWGAFHAVVVAGVVAAVAQSPGCDDAKRPSAGGDVAPASTSPATPTPDVGASVAPPTAAEPRVVFAVAGTEIPVVVELALTPAERAQGLMHREQLADGSGMLFVFPTPTVQNFWMKNTLIRLDMIHLDADGIVVGVVENAPPLTTTPRGVGIPALYVLEVPGGWARGNGIGTDTRATFEGVPAVVR